MVYSLILDINFDLFNFDPTYLGFSFPIVFRWVFLSEADNQISMSLDLWRLKELFVMLLVHS